MNNKKITYLFIGVIVVAAVVGGISGFLVGYKSSTAVAGSNFFSNLWQSFQKKADESWKQTGLSGDESAGFSEQEQMVIAAVKKASPAVVSIVITKDVPVIEQYYANPFGDLPPDFQQFFNFQIPQYRQNGTEKKEVGGGSGFIISSDGMILTNKHVVVDTEASYTVLLNDGRKFEAKVLARDPNNDLALIKIEVTGLSTLVLADFDKVQIGQTAIVIGNALGEYRNTVSVGVVSGLSRSITAGDSSGFSEKIDNVIQTDAAINPGNSGGPLLNLKGEVIGMNTAIALNAENIGFALPINRAKKAIDSYKVYGKIISPYLGVRYVQISASIKEQNKLTVDYGVWVKKGDGGEEAVLKNSPAAKAGVKEGDIILEINSQKIDADHPLSAQLQNYQVGDKIILKVLRDGKEMDIGVTLEERPADF